MGLERTYKVSVIDNLGVAMVLYRFTEEQWELLEQAVMNYDRDMGVIPRTILHGFLTMHNRSLEISTIDNLRILDSFCMHVRRLQYEDGTLQYDEEEYPVYEDDEGGDDEDDDDEADIAATDRVDVPEADVVMSLAGRFDEGKGDVAVATAINSCVDSDSNDKACADESSAESVLPASVELTWEQRVMQLLEEISDLYYALMKENKQG